MKYFKSAKILDELISQYFDSTTALTNTETRVKGKKTKAETDFLTFSGLALHLGFSSTQEMEDYEIKGKYAQKIKRARLRVMADYEKKLHVTSSTGAIFALKSNGFGDRPEPKPTDDTETANVKLEIIQTGPPLANAENEVTL